MPSPIYIEAIITVDLDKPDPTVDLEPAALETLPPGSTVIAAYLTDQVEPAMNERADQLAIELAFTRRALNVMIGAIERGYATPEETLSALRNIVDSTSAPVAGAA